MFNINEKQYIFKLSTDKVKNIYFDEKAGLCLSVLGKRNVWSDPDILQRNAHKYFCAELDKSDIIHVFHQDLSGNLYYTRIADDGKNTIEILSSKSALCYNKHLAMTLAGNTVHFLYALKTGEATMIGHQSFSSENLGAPRAIDYIYPADRPFNVLCDNPENLYVFYSSAESTRIFGYKKYTNLKKFWGEFIQLSITDPNIEHPTLLLDSNSIVHFTFQKPSGKQFQLCYSNCPLEKNSWSDQQLIHSSVYPFTNSSIVCTADSLIVYWVRDDIIYMSSSYDHGRSWSKPAKYPFLVAKQLVCAVFRSNSPTDYGKLIVKEIPACYADGYKLAFVAEASPGRTPATPEELKNMLLDTLEYLRESVEDLKDNIAELNDKQIKLEALLQNFTVEQDKQAIKLEKLEAALKKNA